MKGSIWQIWVALGVVALHALYFAFGNEQIDVGYSWQLASAHSMDLNPWRALWHMHGNPPGFSMLYYWIQRPFPGRVIGFSILLVGLNLLSFWWFSQAAKRVFSGNWVRIACAVFFLNPMVVTYFQYPFYSTYMFILFCLFLFEYTKSNKGAAPSAILLLSGLLRSTFSFPFILWVAAPVFRTVAGWRTWLLVIAFALPSFFWCLKNYELFGQFSASSWVGSNLANGGHIDFEKGLYPFYNKGFDYNARPMLFIDSSLEKRFAHVPELHEQNIHNLNSLYLSNYFKAEFAKQFSFGHSLKIAFLGLFQYFESPLTYPHLRPFVKDIKSGIRNPYFPFDFWDLPNYHRPVKGGVFELPLSLYLFVYPLAFCVAILAILSKRERTGFVDLWILAVITAIYAGVDPYESNRMRMEIEPLWWWVVLIALQYLIKKEFRKTPAQKASA